jgi:hypothetical protein
MKLIWKIPAVGIAAAASLWAGIEASTLFEKKNEISTHQGCVFRTVMGEENSQGYEQHKTPKNVQVAIKKGLAWLMTAQQNNGAWGAGLHSRQDITDPHAVSTDPATTAMVLMALLRSGQTFDQGEYKQQVHKALLYLLDCVENAPADALNITNHQGTQIQSKLGQNIDVTLTAQCLANSLDYLDNHKNLKQRVQKNLDICTQKIQMAQNQDGSIRGAGWAGVLQSSFATNALESAEKKGAKVDKEALQRARDYQKGNLDTKTGNVNTDMGAGIVLYSVSGSTRSAAKEAREAEEKLEKARKEGKIANNAPASAENLRKAGFNKAEAERYANAYQVYNTGKVKAQDSRVMEGFGNNGGEEFLSYLQTGESLIIGKDKEWKKWYNNISGRLLSIQENNGSWRGHHCITSPVFCTATCLLILSVENDLQKLEELGK